MKSGHVVAAIAAALSAACFFLVVLPAQSYLAHADLFCFGISDLLQEYGLYMGASAVALAVFLLAAERFCGRRAHVFLLSLVLIGLLESGVLSLGLPEFNGSFDGYHSFPRACFDGIIVLLVLFVPQFFVRKISKAIIWISAALCLYSFATLFDVKRAEVETAEGMRGPLVPRESVVRCASFSSQRNVFVLILDSISSDAAVDAFRDVSGLSDQFEGFVNYTNNVGMHWATSVAIPGIMTGRYYERSCELGAYGRGTFADGSLFCDYADKGMPVFVNVQVGTKGYTNRQDSQTEDGSRPAIRPSEVRVSEVFSWSINSLSLARILPYAFKETFVRRLGVQGVGTAAFVDVSGDSVLWSALSTAPVREDCACALNVHHSLGGHPPIVFAADGRQVCCSNPTYSDYLGQCEYSLKCLGGFLDSLRKRGLYESSTIFVLGDHGIYITRRTDAERKGVPQAAFPFLMVKAAGAVGRYRESPLATSHSGISSAVRELAHGDLPIDGIERYLAKSERLCRSAMNGKIYDWRIDAVGNVNAEVREDAEPKAEELHPLAEGVVYSFSIEGNPEYPDFILEKGSRASAFGIDQFSVPMRLRVRVPKTGTRYSVAFTVRPWVSQTCLEIASGDDRTEQTLGGVADYGLKMCSVKSDAEGFLDFTFTQKANQGILSVRSIRLDPIE